ncbi:hypothetical protein PCE1_001291 [Barthelona sp. PCE]
MNTPQSGTRTKLPEITRATSSTSINGEDVSRRSSLNNFYESDQYSPRNSSYPKSADQVRRKLLRSHQSLPNLSFSAMKHREKALTPQHKTSRDDRSRSQSLHNSKGIASSPYLSSKRSRNLFYNHFKLKRTNSQSKLRRLIKQQAEEDEETIRIREISRKNAQKSKEKRMKRRKQHRTDKDEERLKKSKSTVEDLLLLGQRQQQLREGVDFKMSKEKMEEFRQQEIAMMMYHDRLRRRVEVSLNVDIRNEDEHELQIMRIERRKMLEKRVRQRREDMYEDEYDSEYSYYDSEEEGSEEDD